MSHPPNEPDYGIESPDEPAASDDWGVDQASDRSGIAQTSVNVVLGRITPRFCAAVAILIAFILGAWLLLRAYTGAHGDGTIYLTGPYVDQLAKDARVVLGQDVIGSVRQIGMHEGQMTATLSIDRSTLHDLPTNTEFVVASLNKWMPGNLGVRVIPPTSADTTQRLTDQAVIRTRTSVLPPVVPPHFWLVVAGCALIVIILAVFAKLLQTLFTFVRIIHGLAFAAVAIVAILTYLNSRISM